MKDVKKIKIAVFDYDGTMRPDYKSATKEMVECWNALKQSGIIPIISTGQSNRKIKAELKKNGFDFPDYIISDHGTVILNNRTDTVIKEITVPNEPVMQIVQEFLKRGGRPEMIRVSNNEKVIAVDCPEAREFFAKKNEPGLVWTNDIYSMIRKDAYCKIILMHSNEIVDSMIPFCEQYQKEILAKNTGLTEYGSNSEIKNFRLELVNSQAGKYKSLQYLIEHMKEAGEIPNGSFVEIFTVGDEMSDLGLAEYSIETNLFPNRRGYFAVIGNDTPGARNLLEEAKNKAKAIGQSDKILEVPSVAENGAVDAVDIWQRKIKFE